MSTYVPSNKVAAWIEHRLPVFSFLQHQAEYRTPRNLNYFWNFGSIAGIILVLQILTGIFLVMNYTAHTHMAFDSVERIMRDVNYGWLLRYMHANGASMFFVVVFIHMFRGLYYGSYKAPRELLWIIGVVILLLMMATAFMGYVLPWGQMSFWGATVITNLFSAFPLVGESIVSWLWGGFSVDNPTLNRFFSLHYLLPFVLVGVVMLHLMALHTHGSNNPTGVDVKTPKDTIPFHPYYTFKDYLGFSVFFLIFSWFIFFQPNILGHPDNYTPANPLVTPPHIVPEWYFLPFYAILRAVTMNISLAVPGVALLLGGIATPFFRDRLPAKLDVWMVSVGLLFLGLLLTLAGVLGGMIESKLGGVLSMFGAIAILFVLPWLDTSPVRSANYRPVYRLFFWIFLLNCILLGYAGSQAADWGTMVGIVTHKEVAAANGASLGWLVITLPDSMQHIADLLPDLKVSVLAMLYYFAHFLVIVPLLPRFEKTKPLPSSIAGAVLGSHRDDATFTQPAR